MSREPMAEPFPLDWPHGWPTTPPGRRQRARYQVEFAKARDDLLRELDLMGARNVIISSNIPVRRDGLPYAKFPRIQEPGVAVYFQLYTNREQRRAGTPQPMVIACDTWDLVKDNVRAIGLTVEAMRSIQRAGASELLERAYQGFEALPPREEAPPWWKVLQVDRNVGLEELRTAYRRRAREVHPDHGGSDAEMQRVVQAFEEACRARGAR